MRTTLLALLAILLGIALGIGIARLRIRAAPWNPEIDLTRVGAAPLRRPDAPLPKVVVDHAKFDFGTLDMASEGSHEFVFTNAGKGRLRLAPGETSCRCTMSKLAEQDIPPGGSPRVTITWKPTEKAGPYKQTAKILTNDPLRREVTLTISGRITAAFRFSPSELGIFPISSAI